MEASGSAADHRHVKRYAALLLIAACTSQPKPSPQNPSPMVDNTRAHGRLTRVEVSSTKIDNVLAKPVDVAGSGDELLIHFHGAAWLPMQAATGRMVAVVNLGQGGGIYEKAFADPGTFTKLVRAIRPPGAAALHIYLSGFSAGYGAIRAILRQHADEIDGVLLLDGLHTSYVPDRKPLAEGGKLDPSNLEPFLAFARRAVAGEKSFVITHSEIFPGTFASTTETTDYLIAQLGLKRAPVVKWGPGGMQQLSEVRAGRLLIIGFAGNSAPDHVDHFHGMPYFLMLLR